MSRITLGLLAGGLVLTACNGDDDETDVVECTNTIVEHFPMNAASDAYYRTTIEVVVAKVEEDAQIAVEGVTGSQSWLGNRLIFTPDAPLSPDTTYNWTFDYSCAVVDFSFTTNAIGTPTGLTDELVGKSFALDLGNARFVKPEGVGALLGQYLTTDILIGVESLDGTDLYMMGAIGLEGAEPPAQDTCSPSIAFPNAATYEDPYFSVGPADTAITVEDITVNLQSLFISGSFTPQADAIVGSVLQGAADTRDFQDLIEEGDICELAGAIGVSCEPCNDGEVKCLSLVVDSISAPTVPGALEAIDDPCTRPECSDDPDCATEEG